MKTKTSIIFILSFLIILLLASIIINSYKIKTVSLNPQRKYYDGELWFSPNIGTNHLDFVNYPQQWQNAFAIMDVMKFSGGDLSNPTYGSAITYQNPNGSVRYLRNRFKTIAVETTVVNADLCNRVSIGEFQSVSQGAILWTTNTLTGLSAKYIAMDSPLTYGWATQNINGQQISCGFTMQQTAQQVANYINHFSSLYALKIGVIVSYPDPESYSTGNAQGSVQRIIQFIQTLEGLNTQLDFVHFDVDLQAVQVYNMNVIQDLRALQNFIKNRPYEMDFGIIINANDPAGYAAVNNQQYYASAFNWATMLKNANIEPDDLVIQSWQPQLGNTIPSNLPETTQYTHTDLLNDVWRLFNGAPYDLSPPTAPGQVSVTQNPTHFSFVDLSWQPAREGTEIVNNYLIQTNLVNPGNEFWPIRGLQWTLSWTYGYTANYATNPPYLTISAVDNEGTIGPALNVPLSQVPPPSGVPTNLASYIPAMPPDGIILTWTYNPSNENAFAIEKTDLQTGSVSISRQGGFSSFSDTTIILGNTYAYRVSACNPWGCSQWSQSITATVPSIIPRPTAPTNLAATASPDGSIILTWIDNSNNEDSFHIQREDPISSTLSWPHIIGYSNANTQTFTDTNAIAPGTLYTYKIRACRQYQIAAGGELCSSWSNPTTATAMSAIQ